MTFHKYLILKNCNYKEHKEHILRYIANFGGTDLLDWFIKLKIISGDYLYEMLDLAFVKGYKSIYTYSLKLKSDGHNFSDYNLKETLNAVIRSINNNNIDVIKFIFDNFDVKEHHQNCLLEACLHGKIKMVKYLVENFPDSNVDYDQALINACQSHYAVIDIVKLLVEKGADVNTSNGMPLNSVFIKYPKIFKYLIIKGAKTNLLKNSDAREILKNNNRIDNIFKLLHDGAKKYTSEQYCSRDIDRYLRFMDNYFHLQLTYPDNYISSDAAINYKYYDSVTI
jgi:ankyrin repeat protein